MNCVVKFEELFLPFFPYLNFEYRLLLQRSDGRSMEILLYKTFRRLKKNWDLLVKKRACLTRFGFWGAYWIPKRLLLSFYNNVCKEIAQKTDQQTAKMKIQKF